MIGLVLLILVAPCQAQTENESAADLTEEPAFTIGIEDVLRIVVWDEPELGGSVKVRPDGMITIPLIHDLKVDGLSPEEVRQEIGRRLGEFVRDPDVTVVVEQINSYRIYLIGEVNTKGALQFYRPMRVLQAIAMAGGPTDFSKNTIILLREEYGIEKRIQIDYKRLLDGDLRQENLYLKPGDTLIFR